jgi:hypothetical protein
VSWWIGENLVALLLGFGVGAALIETFDHTPYIWIVGGLAGVGVALPVWQINKHKWDRRP